LSPNATAGVHNNVESAVFLVVCSRQTAGGHSVATCAAILRAVVMAESDSRLQL